MENEEKFVPTKEWMEENYNKLNQELFGGALGGCILRPFTSGKGANGHTLGWFKITGNNVRVENSTRRIFISSMGGRDYVNRNTFVAKCKPAIELNANYAWTEKAMQSTLLHEMCHYYTYKDGRAPKQGHGPEFYAIGKIVSEKSKGLFPVQRLATAEEMSELDFSEGMLAKIQKNIKKNGSYILFITFTKPYEYSRTKTYKYGYTKIQTKQALDNWRSYVLSHKNSYSQADLYSCNNIQEWAKMSRCNVGRYYLTNDIDSMISNLDAEKTESLLERNAAFEQKQAQKQQIQRIGYQLCRMIYYGTDYNEHGDIITNKGTINVDGVTYNISTEKNAGMESIEWTFDDYNSPQASFGTDDVDFYDHIYDDEFDEKDCNWAGKEALYIIKKFGALQKTDEVDDAEEKVEEPTEDNNTEQPTQSNTIPLFRLNLGNKVGKAMVKNNNAFELRNVTKDEIREKLKERFPKMSDETIEKLMNNPANYPQNEGRKLGRIIENTLHKFLMKEFKIEDNDSTPITPDMNLGLESPLEMAE